MGNFIWDAISLAAGVASLSADIKAGNVKGAIIDSLAIVADVTALALPIIPGGAGAAIKAARVTGAVADVAGGVISVQDGLANGNYVESAFGAVQVVAGAGQLAKTVSAGSKVSEAATSVKTGNLVIDNMQQRVSNSEITPPSVRGNAPISKKDGLPIEIHHLNQNADGPFVEMHATDHRYGENYKKNHSNYNGASTINRKQFRADKNEYWKHEWDKGRFGE